jgi:pyruvate,orthophosphate dikinase
MRESKYVYWFGGGKADGSGEMKDLLGGKGAGLAEMTRAGVPVPPGYTITTEVCRYYYAHGRTLPPGFEEEEARALARLEAEVGRKLGDASDPLLVSVRSGAKFSMPGMMDTILNLGLNGRAVLGLAAKTGDARFANDAYRRLLQMFGNVVLEIDKDVFEKLLAAEKKREGVEVDTGLDAEALQRVIERYRKAIRERSGRPFPESPRDQLVMARDAVFRSWMNDRAATYRRLNGIPHDLGTAVNVQAMVFGNRGETSATGVGFTRNPATGEKVFFGEFLTNAQGEDVVAGTRTPRPIAELEKVLPEAYAELRTITARLEKHYRDVQDFEFTIENGTLYMLQTRNGKRTGPAALRIAVDMVDEGLLSKEEALLRVPAESLDQLLHPVFDAKLWGKALEVRGGKPDAKGLAASPGAATGALVFTADDAVAWNRTGRRVVLLRKETVPDDIHGMHVAEGVLTATGGMTSHAAVVGRQMGKPSVVGASALVIDDRRKVLRVGGRTLREGDAVSIDGATGEVLLESIPTKPSEVIRVIEGALKPEKSETYGYFERFLSWADEVRRLRVRANADIPVDARTAFALGAQGIGLCRTEHMFFASERLPHVVRMILAAEKGQEGLDLLAALDREIAAAGGHEATRLRKEKSTVRARYRKQIDDYTGALAKLLPMQRSDFYGLFREMRGHPVTIRTLDPPLHEFLPKREELLVELATRRAKGGRKRDAKTSRLEKLLHRVEELHEFNPMLGHRGCRLGITYPEITRMQARAIFEAAARARKEGKDVSVEVMIPLVGHVSEYVRQRDVVVETAALVAGKTGVTIPYLVGTMIEVPRGALTAGAIAKEAQFFSFGTNDLTQMTFGYSRDDAGKFLRYYLDHDVLPADPFVTLDPDGVGELVRIACASGREARPDLKLGICGEHGGEPESVAFCHRAGLDYVSCSPYRVPIARLAAAQAALRERTETAKRAAA